MQRLKDGSMPFLSKYRTTRERFAPWNMQIIGMRCRERTYQTPTQHSKLGGGTRTLTLSLPPISCDRSRNLKFVRQLSDSEARYRFTQHFNFGLPMIHP